jgi:putative FmdB family regulatory protein
MPIFEFRCKDCRQVFEKLVAASAAAGEQECPHCGSRSVTRLLSMFAAAGAGARGGGSPGGCCGGGCGCH